MKNLPLHMLNASERETERWRRQKAKYNARIRKEKTTQVARALACVVVAAQSVVDNWESRDLAECVRNLSHALKDYKEASNK